MENEVVLLVEKEEESEGSCHNHDHDDTQDFVALRTGKQKMVVVDHNPNFMLSVKIERTVDIDNLSFYFYVNGLKPAYYVTYWVNPEEQFRTRVVRSSLKHIWGSIGIISLGNNAYYCDFLYLEVIRLCIRSEPGTSTGRALVARARVPLPRVLNRVVTDKFDMVSLHADGHKPQGFIQLSMEVFPVAPGFE